MVCFSRADSAACAEGSSIDRDVEHSRGLGPMYDCRCKSPRRAVMLSDFSITAYLLALGLPCSTATAIPEGGRNWLSSQAVDASMPGNARLPRTDSPFRENMHDMENTIR
jgi:hypothetical protein